MSIKHTLSAFTIALLFLVGTAASSLAQPPAVPSTDPSTDLHAAEAAASAAQDAEDASLEPAEPDFRLINLPTTMRLPRFKGNFDLTHRFGGNLRQGSFADQASSLFGLDDGATVGFEYRMAVARHLEAAIYRSALERTVQFYGKYDALHQKGSMPLSASVVVSVEGADNFHRQYAPGLGVSVSRTLRDTLAVYVVPTWVHNSAATTGVNRDTVFVGVGGRLRVRDTVYLVGEVSPRMSGFAPGTPEYGFALEKRAGGHMFQLNFTNTSGTTLAQIARGGPPDSLSLGFNLSRKFF
jgi:hypothetical protein